MRDPTQSRRRAGSSAGRRRSAAVSRTQRHHTNGREGAEEPPLDRVEQVADRGEPAGVRQLLEVGRHQASVPARRAGDDVRAVQVLVEALRKVGHPQLREHVVGRVVVGGARAFRGLEPADQVGGPARREVRRPGRRRPAADHRQQRSPTRTAADHPVAVLPVVLAAGHPERRVAHPGAVHLDRLPDRSPGTGRRGRSRRPAGSGATCVRSRASASRRSCQPWYCHSPSQPGRDQRRHEEQVVAPVARRHQRADLGHPGRIRSALECAHERAR